VRIEMASQWTNFLANLGEWHGSFDALDGSGAVLSSTPSILSLEAADNDTLVHFSLRRFGPEGRQGEPISETRQDYRTLGRQVVFFASGCFCKGSLQVAPGTAFGAEFGFIHADRRHRLVQLHHSDGRFERLVLIREHRAGTPQAERPPLTPEQLQGLWIGTAATITAEWPEPAIEDAQLRFEHAGPSRGSLALQRGANPAEYTCTHWGPGSAETSGSAQDRMIEQMRWLPDGGYQLGPELISHRRGFTIQAGWLREDHTLDCLIRCYDATGAWQSATWLQLKRVQAS